MASIITLSPSKYTACGQGDMLEVEFKVSGNISCFSSLLTPVFKYRNKRGVLYGLDIYDLRLYTDNDMYSIINKIDVEDLYNKTFKFKVRIPEDDESDGISNGKDYITCYFYLEGEDENETGTSLGLVSEEFIVSTIRSGYFITTPIETKTIMNNIKVDLLIEEELYLGDVVDYKIEVSNNPFDDNPIWEDITENYYAGNFSTIVNAIYETKPGISVKVTITKRNFNSVIKIKEVNLCFY